MISKLALGTVQFGMKYGIANTSGQVPLDEIKAILSLAKNHNVTMLDTAIAYGDAEKRLGDIDTDGFHIVSKLPSCKPEDIEHLVNTSLNHLKTDTLYGLLLHSPDNLHGPDGKTILTAMQALQNKGLVKKIGVSIYAPDDLDAIFDMFTPDIVQAPFNIMDQRLEISSWLDRLKDKNAEVHTRSAFLQGLLLMKPEERPAKFNRWQSQWQTWHNWLKETEQTPLQACLSFALANEAIDKVIVGVDSSRQWQDILAVKATTVTPPESLAVQDEHLINPALWNTL